MSPARNSDAGAPPPLDALLEQARAAEREGEHTTARSRYESALWLLSGDTERPTAAALLRWIGTTHREEGDGEAAMDCYRASLAAAELVENPHDMAHALNCVGIVESRWGRLHDAASSLRRARELAGSSGSRRLLAMIEQNLGVIANTHNDFERALEHYRRSLDLYRELDDERFLGQVLNNLGMVHTDLGDWEEAEGFFRRAAGLAERVEDVGTRIMVETNRTELYIVQDEYHPARESCDVAFELATRYEHHLGLGEVYKNYGVIYRETEKYGLAEAHLTTATEIAERYSNPLLAAEVQRELAQLYRRLDRTQEALQALNYAHRIFNDLQAQRDLADTDRRIGELERTFLEIVRRWGESIESKDDYTAGHCERVAEYSCLLARAVGYDEQTLTWFRMGAYLHDVGKTEVPPEILNKPGRLDADEWEIMRRHTIIGEELVSAIDFPWDIRPMIRSHHEHWEGSGYPDGLAGQRIPLSARMLCIADAFDALTTERSYRGGHSVDDALAIMGADAGRVFDPDLFEIFRERIRERLDDPEREPSADRVAAAGGGRTASDD